jgi:hypothetical protein
VAVPAFAAVGVVVLGVIALVIACVFAAVEAPGDVDWAQLLSGFGGWTSGGRRNRRK